jgi:hypothetical protein
LESKQWHDKGLQECDTESTECRSSRTRVIRNVILMLQRVNSSKTKIVKRTILMPHSVEVA